MFTIVALATAGCATVAPEQPPVRTVRDVALVDVVAVALDALAAAGARGAVVKPEAGGGRTVIRAWMVAGGYERNPFLVEVKVASAGATVRVMVAADPMAVGAGSGADGLQHAGDAARASTGCGCAADDPIAQESRPRDNLLLLAQGRRVVGAVLAAFDARLR